MDLAPEETSSLEVTDEILGTFGLFQGYQVKTTSPLSLAALSSSPSSLAECGSERRSSEDHHLQLPPL